MPETILKLNYGGFPPLSARGCVQTLTPLKTGDFRRTVNGQLVYTGLQTHHKYASTIQCEDKSPPAIEGLWRGAEVIVECIQPLCHEFKGNGKTDEITLERLPVKGSVHAINAKKRLTRIQEIKEQTLKLAQIPESGVQIYIYYRPILRMRVIAFSLKTNEWGTNVGWNLYLEEV